MEQFQCINKVWISEKGRILDRVLWVCGWICLVLNLIVLLMEGKEAVSLPSVIFAFCVLFWSGLNKKRTGRYTDSLCILYFADQMLIWEYPELDLGTGRGVQYVKYTVIPAAIEDVQMSYELQSIRLSCKPLIESTDKRGKKSTLDCLRKNRQCSLILYNENVEYVQYCIQRYLNVNVNIVG